MIRIKTIHIEDFRGIRDLTLNLDSENFGISGPNGTGKSGVVDAIEFCITGDVTRLSGQGTSDLSVKDHAPHVEQRNHPEKANVTIKADIPSLGKSVTIHRSVKNPRQVKISPTDSDVKRVIEELQTHPEFALSRREIVKYIITPPGKRAKDVQTLLRLDYVERLRKNFTTLSNNCIKAADEAERIYSSAKTELANALKIDKFEHSSVLQKVNEKRKLLKLQSFSELTKDTSFKEGIAAGPEGQKKPILSKTVALADISALQSAIKKSEPADLAANQQSAKTTLEKLKNDEKAQALARQHGFIKTGLDLITEDACPLCDTEWNAEELRELLRNKLLSAEEIEQLLKKLQSDINSILQALSTRIQASEQVAEYCQNLEQPFKKDQMISYIRQLKKSQSALTSFLEDHSKIEPTLQAISTGWWAPPTETQHQIDACHVAVKALPDTLSEDEAREILIVAQERYEKLQAAKKTVEQHKTRSVVAQKVLNHYNANCTKVLEDIYSKVAEDFTKYYRAINNKDEETHVGQLEALPAKLNLNVDFYGHGFFPPGAYHSEGHQDGMGFCLYLALMKHTLGDNFTFAVLDDILMSVDTGHRREVCRLLKSEFPETQFILTTHDIVWLKYMRTEGLIAKSQSFAGWTVKSGPRVWNDKDIWTEIQEELDRNNVNKAAFLLRHYLEFTAPLIADRLRARIEFRGDGNYGLGDFLPNALAQWQKRLEQGEKSATKWGHQDKKEALATERANVKKLIALSNVEQWAINPSVHFNEWANLQSHEFRKVVDTFKELLKKLRCDNPDCNTYLYVMPRMGTVEEMRCSCGAKSINLKMKP